MIGYDGVYEDPDNLKEEDLVSYCATFDDTILTGKITSIVQIEIPMYVIDDDLIGRWRIVGRVKKENKRKLKGI